MSSTTRDRILDALQQILIERGPSAATLEAVATAAAVSKGGLLYHFPSKAEMMTALIRRLAERAEAEFRQALEGDEGVTRVFLRVSLPQTSQEAALYWSIIAALRGNEDISAEAREIVHGIFARWSHLLHEEIGDPVLAETVRLVGDGLYLSALADLPQPDPAVLRALTDRLTEQAAVPASSREAVPAEEPRQG
ncbi:TetR/AcrR family transcriptional regulator [Salinactinospora qingdaonensis]|uniref:TetR/AcrR family transcriptional regulator n=1 Tax=Salinactinospora qingdaonensis TaxID=702744 RepID=A0ABP7FS52_9ACTN